MTRVLRKTRTSAVLRGFMLLLGVAIFTWGLHGKLTLYKTPTPSRRTAVVKFISDIESNKKNCPSESRSCGSTSQIILLNPIEPFPPRFTLRRNCQVSRQVFPAILSYSHALLFRPPPSIA